MAAKQSAVKAIRLAYRASTGSPSRVFRSKSLLCHDLPVSSNTCFKLKQTPRGWAGWAFYAAIPVIVPGLVSLTKPRPVQMTGWGYGLFAVMAALIVLRHVRSATMLEAAGIRMRRTFSVKYLPWKEITGVEISERGKMRFAQVRTSFGKTVRLPAPMAGGGFDGSRFDAQVAEITAAWVAANPIDEHGEVRHSADPGRVGRGSHEF
jgi:hypothetical protein